MRRDITDPEAKRFSNGMREGEVRHDFTMLRQMTGKILVALGKWVVGAN